MKQKLLKAIEAYRQAGGREEHWITRDNLDVLLDEILEPSPELACDCGRVWQHTPYGWGIRADTMTQAELGPVAWAYFSEGVFINAVTEDFIKEYAQPELGPDWDYSEYRVPLYLNSAAQRKPLSNFAKAAIYTKYFGNPIPKAWYEAVKELEAAHGIGTKP